MYNKIILVGNLTRDPEIRYTTSGMTVCSFTLAVNSEFKQTEDAKKEVLFIDIIAFQRLAEVCGQYLSKGKTALVEGRLQERRWETKEGQQRNKCEVVASTVRFLSKKGDTSIRSDEYPPDDNTIEDPF
jgi:single-strand DNA-binding protein